MQFSSLLPALVLACGLVVGCVDRTDTPEPEGVLTFRNASSSALELRILRPERGEAQPYLQAVLMSGEYAQTPPSAGFGLAPIDEVVFRFPLHSGASTNDTACLIFSGPIRDTISDPRSGFPWVGGVFGLEYVIVDSLRKQAGSCR